MLSSPIASLIAVEATRRALTAPTGESRRPRRTPALGRRHAARRLDPSAAPAPQAALGR